MAIGVPLKLKDSADYQDFTSTEENYLAYQIGEYLITGDSSSVGSLALDSNGSNLLIGNFTDTSYDSAIGTGGDGSFLTFTTVTTPLRTTLGTLTVVDSDYRIPIYQYDSDGQKIIQEAKDSDLTVLVDRLSSRIFTSDYLGSYRLGSAPPSGDYTLKLNDVMTDTRTDGNSVQYNIYQRTTQTAPTKVLPFSVKRSNGDSGDYQGLQLMTDRQIQQSLGLKARNRLGEYSDNIGNYRLLSSVAGTPTDVGLSGTWASRGTATDTRQAIVDANYTRGRVSTYSRLRESNFTDTYTRTRSSAFSADYTTTRSSAYTANYVTTRTSNYSLGFVGNYIGNFTRTRQTDFTRTRNSTFDYVGDYVGDFTGNYSRLLGFTGNFTGNYVGAQNYSIPSNSTFTYDVTINGGTTAPTRRYTFEFNGFQTNPADSVDIWWNGVRVVSGFPIPAAQQVPANSQTTTVNSVTSGGYTYYRGPFRASDRFGTLNIDRADMFEIRRTRVGEADFTRDSTRNSLRTSTYTRNSTQDFLGNYTRTLTYTGNYTGDFLGEYTSDFTRTTPDDFTRDFIGNYTGEFTRNRASTYTRTRGSTYIGDYLGNYTGDFTGDFTGDYLGNFIGNYVGGDTQASAKLSETSPRYYYEVRRTAGGGKGEGEETLNIYWNDVLVGFSVQSNVSLGLSTSFVGNDGYTYYRAGTDNFVKYAVWRSAPDTFTRDSTRTSTTNFTRTSLRTSTRTSTREGSLTYLGNFAGNFIGNYVGTATYTSAYTYVRTVTPTDDGNLPSTTSGEYYWLEADTDGGYNSGQIVWNGTVIGDPGTGGSDFTVGGVTYQRGTFQQQFQFDQGYWNDTYNYYTVRRTYDAEVDYTRTSTRTSTRTVTNFEGNYSRNFEGNYSTDFSRTRTSTYLGSDTFSRNFEGNYLGNYTRNFTRSFEGNYSRNFEGEYVGDYTQNYIGDYARTFTGNYAGSTIGSGNTTIETYTLYVRIA